LHVFRPTFVISSPPLGDFKGLRALAAAAGKHLQHGVVIYSGEHVLPFKVENRKFFAVPIGLFLTADKIEYLLYAQ